MSIKEALVEKVQLLPVEKQQEVLDFVDFLLQKNLQPQSRRSLKGLLSHLNLDITAEDFTEARREMWKDFPRDIN
jgi:hypothetical protein